MPPRDKCCWCIPFRVATFIGGLLLGLFGAGGSYFYFTHTDLPKRSFEVAGITLSPFTSGQPLWYYFAAVSVLAAFVGLFGMVSALSANRRMVKAFEAFYVLSLLTQCGLIAWSLIYCKQRQTDFDTACNASKENLIQLPIPGFASDWDCRKTFTVIIVTIAVGGVLWILFNFYMTNRVIHYARELFAEKANRYKVLGEAAVKELDREQQIPLNYTNVGTNNNKDINDQESFHNSHAQQPSYRDEIEYKTPQGDDYQHSRAAAAGFRSYDQGLSEPYQHQHQQPIAPGFNPRDSTQGLDLVNPYYEQETMPAPMAVETTQANMYSTPAPYLAQGTSQSFVHASNNKIPSPFDDDDEPVAAVAPMPHDDIKVPLPPSPVDGIAESSAPASDKITSPPYSHPAPVGSSSSKGEPYQF